MCTCSYFRLLTELWPCIQIVVLVPTIYGLPNFIVCFVLKLSISVSNYFKVLKLSKL